MRFVLKRISSLTDATLGVFLFEGEPICLSMENKWHQNERYVSCIPSGTYKCSSYSSDKYPNVYEVKDVPGRTAILIHIGNTASDTQGCILPGSEFGYLKGKHAVLGSAKAMNKLRDIIKDREFFLTIEEV